MKALPHNAAWHRIKRLTDRALELPAEERVAFLDRACGVDSDVRRQVDRLLDREHRVDGFLERPFFSLRVAEASPELDRRIGPYRLIRRLGKGGMGTVYLAERADGELHQEVALKLLKRGLDSEEMLFRFQRERQILADLSHPFIARLLDVGTAGDGRPFFAMEYVQGARIDTWCDQKRLGVRQRLKLFRQVCEAIHFAHQNLVVHRDLKPANILITAEGAPRLLDFGIAKLLDRNPRFTAVISPRGTAPLSLPYASPEQLAGSPVTTATDVYALGVILYRLLTGRSPQRFDGPSLQDALHQLRRERPRRPSAAVLGRGEITPALEAVGRARSSEPKRLSRELAGDLDNIVLKALSPEPERRYSSAEQLSEELRRYLAGLPVRARPDTFLYRTGKLVRRHKIGVAVTCLSVALVVGSGTAIVRQGREIARQNQEITRQNQEITRQNQEIARERDRANWVTDFLVHLPEAPVTDWTTGKQLTVREALNAGVERLYREFAEEPEVRATLLDALGSSYRHLLAYEQAHRLLAEALRLRRELYGDDHALVAATLHNLAQLKSEESQTDEAERLMREALRIQRRHFPAGHRDLARGLNNLASLLASRNQDLEEATALARESLQMKESLFGADHREVTSPLSNLATLLRNQGRLEEAAGLYRRCLQLRRRLEPANSPELAKISNSLASLLIDLGDLESAMPLYEEALLIRRSLHAEDHPHLVSSLNNLGRLQILRGEPKLAVGPLTEGLAVASRLAAGGRHAWLVAAVEKNLAWAHLELREPTACEARARSALTIFQRHGKAQRAVETEGILEACRTG